MKKLLTIIFCVLFSTACKENDASTGGDERFNVFTPRELYFDSDGGVQTVTATDYILLHGVYLYKNGKSKSIASVSGECIRQYPYIVETEWVTVNRTDAATLEITVPPRTDKTIINILVSGIADDGDYLCPSQIQIYQNYETE